MHGENITKIIVLFFILYLELVIQIIISLQEIFISFAD